MRKALIVTMVTAATLLETSPAFVVTFTWVGFASTTTPAVGRSVPIEAPAARSLTQILTPTNISAPAVMGTKVTPVSR